MERAIDSAEADLVEEVPELIAIPRPRSNGTDILEDMGPVVDRLVGAARGRKRAAEELEPLFAEQEGAAPEPEPEPIEVPEARPGGTEPMTRGEDRAGGDGR